MLTDLLMDLPSEAALRTSIAIGAQSLERAMMARIALYVAVAVAGSYVTVDTATRTTIEECMESSKAGRSECDPEINIFIVGDDNSEVQQHIGEAIADLKPPMLSRASTAHDRDWIDAFRGPGKACSGAAGTDCDEYPFAASMEGGQFGNVSLKSVNASQNRSVGAHLRWFYNRCKVPADNPSKKYAVIPMRGIEPTGYVCAK
jgi:hypothetical protein